MSFEDLDLNYRYMSLSDKVAQDFYIPCLKEAVSYIRGVGYFSSGSLLQISKGLGSFADRGGKMRLMVSTRLSEEDFNAISDAYKHKEYNAINNIIVPRFDFDVDFPDRERRFGLLEYMISNGYLDIKIIALKENNDYSLFHIKEGVMRDSEGNLIAFNGSMNDTDNAYNSNYESFDVFRSWSCSENKTRCLEISSELDEIWTNNDKNVIALAFPDLLKEKLKEYRAYVDHGTKYIQIDDDFIKRQVKKKESTIENASIESKLYDYQLEAIDNWEKQNYRGIFDMATGTGKTYTGIGAMCRLLKTHKHVLCVIVAPFIHLIDQWYDELQNFKINAIKCYGVSKGYSTNLDRELTALRQRSSDYACLLVTNKTFQSDSFQNRIKPFQNSRKHSVLLIVDEAHNFGAAKISKFMDDDSSFKYRLALSATLERYRDEEGTKKLIRYFGDKCITYSLERAIAEDKLTQYEYHPVLVTLTSDEYEEYVELSNKISKFPYDHDDEMPQALQRLYIKRARLIAGAKNKVDALKEVIEPYKHDSNMLIYCGAVKYGQADYGNEASVQDRQLTQVQKMLSDMGIVNSKFTAEEDASTRKDILDNFKNQKIQALVAIKCLDEGLNVPAIRTAFILASSTNPKEYIQRRGRVLRRAEGKDCAVIYDFVTLPPARISGTSIHDPYYNIQKKFVNSELSRVNDFAHLAKNTAEVNATVNEIKERYSINIISEPGEDYYYG